MVIKKKSDDSRGILSETGPWSLAGYFALILFSCWLGLAGGLTIISPSPVEVEKACFYQRERAACGHDNKNLQVLVVGDVMLGRGVDLSRYPFRTTAYLLHSADISVANFEGALSNHQDEAYVVQTEGNLQPYVLAAPPHSVDALQSAGFDLVSLANNHSLDAGRPGLGYTLETLQSAGIKVVGAGRNAAEAYAPLIFQAKGIRLAFIGVNAIPYPLMDPSSAGRDDWQIADWDKERLFEAIRLGREQADGVIVMVHWGDEYQPNPGITQRLRAAELIDMGADAVIGSHAHSLQETAIISSEKRGGKIGYTAYSLGNFVFDQSDSRAQLGLALWLEFDQGGLVEVQARMVHAGNVPSWKETADQKAPIDQFKPAPQQLAFSCSHDQCEMVDEVIPVPKENKESFAVDLTGDGVFESIILGKGNVTIFEGTIQVYKSPPEWNVLDLAVGDPNHDGRFEAVLALEKPDAGGEIRSHPFLIGYRGGIYRLIWGGSAVPLQILEIEVADLDGDRDDELIVLEDCRDGLHLLSVWRYNNWFFSQVWSASPDRFQGLSLSHQKNGQPLITIGRKW